MIHYTVATIYRIISMVTKNKYTLMDWKASEDLDITPCSSCSSLNSWKYI